MKRITIQRKAIMEIFKTIDRPLRINEIVDIGRQRVKSLNPATVYRNLKILVSNGEINQISLPSLGTLYERSGKAHHHHFYCYHCERVFELPGCVLKKETKTNHGGYVIKDHEVFLFGICPACADSV